MARWWTINHGSQNCPQLWLTLGGSTPNSSQCFSIFFSTFLRCFSRYSFVGICRSNDKAFCPQTWWMHTIRKSPPCQISDQAVYRFPGRPFTPIQYWFFQTVRHCLKLLCCSLRLSGLPPFSFINYVNANLLFSTERFVQHLPLSPNSFSPTTFLHLKVLLFTTSTTFFLHPVLFSLV